ncbi:hypothetical protein HB847_04045 [Listeria booriae]|uniref:O-antigen ligase-related domain-containing protein n=1 Tax=Listeria booriae TaxID=1552123 RepID=A0A841XWA0_9LIST|nr:O-antigen ligase family protein [Listeria booriae]MBC1371531.1 hypothetical protein [Listeria booriae]
MTIQLKAMFPVIAVLLAVAVVYEPLLLGIPIICLVVMLGSVYPLEKTTKILWYVLIISAFFGSFLSIPGLSNLFLYRILLPIHVLLFLVTYSQNKGLAKADFRYIWLLLLFLATGFIPLIWAEYPLAVLRNLYYVVEAIYLIYTCMYYLRDATVRQQLLRLIPLAVLPNIVIALYEITTGQHLTKSSLTEAIGNTMYLPSGVFFNPNDLAAFLTIFIPIYIVLYTEKAIGVRLMKIGLAIAGMYIVIATESRICIALLATMLLIILFHHSKKWLLAMILGLVVIIPLVLQMDSFATLDETIENIYTGKQNSTDVRMDISSATWQLAQDKFLIGAGPGNAQFQLINYFLTDELSGNDTIAVHNFLLEVLANYGVQSAIFFYSFLLLIFIRSIRLSVTGIRNWLYRSMPLLLSTSLTILFFSSSTTLEKPYIWIGFGIILSLLITERLEQKT